MVRSPMCRRVLIAVSLLASSRIASASLIANGDFENGTFTQSGTGDNLPNNWTNSQADNNSKLNVYPSGSGPGAPESGSDYIAFQGAPTDSSQDCLNQIVAGTVANQQYTLGFWVGMTANSQSQFGMTIEWDSGGAHDVTLGSGDFFDHPTSSSAVSYTFFSFTETASSSSTSIYFHGADATGAIMLDNVSLVAVPEPRWFLAPILGLFALLRRPRGGHIRVIVD